VGISVTDEPFRRRWFFIAGAVLALFGNIVAATAQSIPALIGATALIGLAASTQLSFSFVSNELVPMKYRFVTNAWLYIWTGTSLPPLNF
jgi:predicted MFS family arabinose efflux permease